MIRATYQWFVTPWRSCQCDDLIMRLLFHLQATLAMQKPGTSPWRRRRSSSLTSPWVVVAPTLTSTVSPCSTPLTLDAPGELWRRSVCHQRQIVGDSMQAPFTVRRTTPTGPGSPWSYHRKLCKIRICNIDGRGMIFVGRCNILIFVGRCNFLKCVVYGLYVYTCLYIYIHIWIT